MLPSTRVKGHDSPRETKAETGRTVIEFRGGWRRIRFVARGLPLTAAELLLSFSGFMQEEGE